MSLDETSSSASSGADAGDLVLADAAASLRSRVDPRWVAISDRVLARAMTATRRSYPVRAVSPNGTVHVSEQVIIAHLRAALAGEVPGVALDDVQVQIEGRDAFGGVTLFAIVAYGQPILPASDRIHELATAELERVLGPLAPAVSVRATHVHVSDVAVGDPEHAEIVQR